MKMRLMSGALCAAIAVSADSVRADLVFVPGGARSVSSVASFAAPDSDVSPAPGLFLEDAASVGIVAGTPGGVFTGHGAQGSDTPVVVGPSMAGAGLGEGSAEARGVIAFGLMGESVFDVLFTVTHTGPATLDAMVEWGGDVPVFTGTAFVELSVAGGAVLHGVTKGSGDPGMAGLLVSPVLTAGTVYRLHAVARVDSAGGAEGVFDARGDWTFRLTHVPEMSGLMLMAPLALGLALAAYRRRRLALFLPDG
jgi:hypothetical protein